jgi:Domain of unknown function (DUF4272)
MVSHISLERKRRSEAILQKEGVPFIAYLPVIEDEETAQIRSLEEVAWRAMALNIVAVKGEGLEHDRVLEIIEQYNLEHALTPNEREFILNDEPSEHDRIQFAWRYECYWVLLWALSYIGELGRPDQICDVPRAVRVMVDRTAEEFIRDGKLRGASEILDATDLIYRYHWACVDARLKGGRAPVGLDAGVVMERHHALNWLVGYADNAEWDDVSTDT